MRLFNRFIQMRHLIWLLPVAIVCWVFLNRQPKSSALPGPVSYANLKQNPVQSKVNRSVAPVFAAVYPASDRLQEELRYVRQIGKLRPENEELINRVITAMAMQYNMPSSVLWCLLFQESRLDHLRGIADDSGSRGIGQFSSFGFYEVNHNLDKYYAGSLKAWIELLGKDVRPISAEPKSLDDPSSYFYIPTAVISSATYLNNRYHHLGRLLTRNRVPYDPQLLWLHAALAYNKGSRSVLVLWKETHRHHRKISEKLFVDRKAFLSAVASPDILEKALMRIWTPAKAKSYSREAKRHMAVINECSISNGVKP